ncbi:MAG: hypothetical protein PHV53_10395 [Fermentimonas sp.]|nr:hypothetical protein [Fermentimonas sp.]
MKISMAIYRRDDIEKVINVADLNRTLYNTRYRGYLFCLEDGCNAWLCYVESKKNDSGFFRTWSKKEHKEGCPYEVNYDKFNDGSLRKFGDKNINISNKHINEKLRRTYEQIFLNISNPGKSPVKLIYGEVNRREEELKGEPALFDLGINIDGEREPYILTRRFDKLDESDIDKTRCVFGEVRSMSILNNHAYINLTNKTEKSIKIYFSEYFRAGNTPVFENLHLIKQYIDELRKQRLKINCCCIGWITKVRSGFNIHPDRFNGFILNGLGFYEIIRR